MTDLRALLEDDSVTEVIVNGVRDSWVERGGVLHGIGPVFSSPEELDQWARGLLQGTGRRVDRRSPMADARLPDGSRVCVVAEPAVLGGMHVNVRKFPKHRLSLTDLVGAGFLTEGAAALLLDAVRSGKNIFLSGGTGAGKTTLLNALIALVPHGERIITLEDTAELLPDHPHVVRLEARPANAEGEGAIELRALVRCALRMRPDRLVMGECRGPEALDLLQSLNTGHRGSMGTIHANSAREALGRLELLCQMAMPQLTLPVLRALVAGAIHVVAHVERVNGRRRLASLHEVAGTEEGTILLRTRNIR
ncbi:MAG: CpaF family protein [Bdellovibrionales bacterium]|nr:CpaF family protein [Bdellovibrionales bacterium]